MKSPYITFGLLTFILSGCLVTRQEVRESVRREPLTPEQQARSNSEVRYQEVDEQMRQLLGRIETLENSVNVLNADKSGSRIEQQNEKKALQEKLKIYEEALGRLESQYLQLAQKLESMQQQSTSASKNSRSSSNKGTFDTAETEFGKKRWKEAIVAFEKYRSTNPSGRRYGEATYKIGAAFHELSMKNEAKAFYSEVVEKFPKSDWAKKATQRLKTLK